MKIQTALISLLVVLGPGITVNLQGQEAVSIKHLTSPIEFDGVPKEAAWSELEMFPMTMHRPNFGSDPSEVSDIRIGYDDLYLWVGASLYMRDATKIFDATKKRDDRLFSFDAIGILLDTYNDNENGLAFFTTPSGLRTDYSISNDAAGGGGPMGSMMNFNWNTFWDVKTTRDEKGWYAEMRIPFSSLKFKPEGNTATMGIIITRNISANNETDSYPSIDPKFGFLATLKPSQAQTIKIEDARPSKPVYITPYLIGGLSQEWVMNESETGYERVDDPKLNAGLDVKYNINSNLTLDLTANTDFAQVEADDQQVNLTRYSLFFPEKRVFFQERSSLFDFSLGGRADNLFYSRNIGIANGEPIRIYGGARLTGRVGKWDLGFIDMQTAGEDTIPSENFGVLRMRRQVINPNTYVGGILTSRLGDDGHQNLAYGIDWIYRVFGDDYMNLKWAQAYDSEAGTRLNSLDPSFILADWERRTEEGIAYKVNYTYLGNSFDPGIGFVRRVGVKGLNGNLSYGWLPGTESKLFSYNVTVRGEKYTRIVDNGLESQQISPGFELTTKNRIRAEVSLNLMKEGVNEDFSVAENITIPAGLYSFYNSEMRFSTSDARKISIRSNLNLGQFYDGFRYGMQAEPNLNVSSSFRMSLSYQYNALRFPDRAEESSADLHLVNVKAIYMFSTKLSASVMMQYANTEEELVTNFRLRYNPREGNDFYIVYNGGRNTYRDLDDPRLPLYNSRALLLKYTYTFIL
jgi:hypothetical protein